MPSTIDIRRRIRSVKNTQQITKAMKMVAAAKLRRSQERIFAARPYAAALRDVLVSLASRVEQLDHPLLREREERNVLILVITGDKGLCGAFNSNVIRAAMNALRDGRWAGAQLIPIGRKGADAFRRRAVQIRHQAINVFQALSPGTAREIAQLLVEDYTTEKVDAVYVIYNEFKSLLQQIVRLEKLLPIEHPARDAAAPAIDYLYEPAPAIILDELLPKYVEYQLYRVMLESAAAEHAARRNAMEAATRNASDMIDALTLKYNRIRQAAITKEIIEIVSGAAAQD